MTITAAAGFEASRANEATGTVASGSVAVQQRQRPPRSSRGCIPKKFRHPMTPAQRSLLAGARQHSRLRDKIAKMQWIGCDLVDLVSHESRLVIEIESEPVALDPAAGERDARLRLLGYQVLRIRAREVLRNVHAVLDQLAPLLDPISPAMAVRGSSHARSAAARRGGRANARVARGANGAVTGAAVDTG